MNFWLRLNGHRNGDVYGEIPEQTEDVRAWLTNYLSELKISNKWILDRAGAIEIVGGRTYNVSGGHLI